MTRKYIVRIWQFLVQNDIFTESVSDRLSVIASNVGLKPTRTKVHRCGSKAHTAA